MKLICEILRLGIWLCSRPYQQSEQIYIDLWKAEVAAGIMDEF